MSSRPHYKITIQGRHRLAPKYKRTYIVETGRIYSAEAEALDMARAEAEALDMARADGFTLMEMLDSVAVEPEPVTVDEVPSSDGNIATHYYMVNTLSYAGIDLGMVTQGS